MFTNRSTKVLFMAVIGLLLLGILIAAAPTALAQDLPGITEQTIAVDDGHAAFKAVFVTEPIGEHINRICNKPSCKIDN